jgi:hypothetical protein
MQRAGAQCLVLGDVGVTGVTGGAPRCRPRGRAGAAAGNPKGRGRVRARAGHARHRVPLARAGRLRRRAARGWATTAHDPALSRAPCSSFARRCRQLCACLVQGRAWRSGLAWRRPGWHSSRLSDAWNCRGGAQSSTRKDSRGAHADALARAELEAVLPAPKPRSKTWLSTCFPLDSEDPAAAACGPGYHVRPAAGSRRPPAPAALLLRARAPRSRRPGASPHVLGASGVLPACGPVLSVGAYHTVHGMPEARAAERRARARARRRCTAM